MTWFLAETPAVLDASGECGTLVHYGFVLALVGSAFLIFLYLWRKNKLDMDEEPKHKMMNDQDHEGGGHA
jgi:uncharacterized membrane protein